MGRGGQEEEGEGEGEEGEEGPGGGRESPYSVVHCRGLVPRDHRLGESFFLKLTRGGADAGLCSTAWSRRLHCCTGFATRRRSHGLQEQLESLHVRSPSPPSELLLTLALGAGSTAEPRASRKSRHFSRLAESTSITSASSSSRCVACLVANMRSSLTTSLRKGRSRVDRADEAQGRDRARRGIARIPRRHYRNFKVRSSSGFHGGN